MSSQSPFKQSKEQFHSLDEHSHLKLNSNTILPISSIPKFNYTNTVDKSPFIKQSSRELRNSRSITISIPEATNRENVRYVGPNTEHMFPFPYLSNFKKLSRKLKSLSEKKKIDFAFARKQTRSSLHSHLQYSGKNWKKFIDRGFRPQGMDLGAGPDILAKIQPRNPLKMLHLHSQSLSNDNLQAITKSIQGYDKLESLLLVQGSWQSKISNNGVGYLTDILPKFSKLSSLLIDFSWGYNSITNDSALQLLKSLQRSECWLQKFGIKLNGGHNKITDIVMEELSQLQKKFYELKYLQVGFSFGKNEITDKGIKALANGLENVMSLEALILDFSSGRNQITDQGMQELSQVLQINLNILKLEIKFSGAKNAITNTGFSDLGSALKNHKQIRSIGLNFGSGNNEISDWGILDWATVFENNKDLEHFGLELCRGQNDISQTGVLSLLNAFKGNQNLKSVLLDLKGGKAKFSVEEEEDFKSQILASNPGLRFTFYCDRRWEY